MRKLVRSRHNRMLAGILGGIAEYFHIDPTIVRVIFVILLLCTAFFPFGILYIILYFIIPGEDSY